MNCMIDSYYLPTTNINNNNTGGIVDSIFSQHISKILQSFFRENYLLFIMKLVPRYTKKKKKKKKQENTDHRKHTKRNTKKRITKNTSHGAYIVHNCHFTVNFLARCQYSVAA